jgi:hypothetical protein
MVHTGVSNPRSRMDPSKDVQTVDSTGYRIGPRIGPRIDGVVVTPTAPQEDERGELCEIWTADRDPLGLPVAHAYMLTVRTGKKFALESRGQTPEFGNGAATDLKYEPEPGTCNNG